MKKSGPLSTSPADDCRSNELVSMTVSLIAALRKLGCTVTETKPCTVPRLNLMTISADVNEKTIDDIAETLALSSRMHVDSPCVCLTRSGNHVMVTYRSDSSESDG